MTMQYVEDEKLNQEIIEGMKQDGYIEGDASNNTEIIENELLKTEWKKEARNIPLDEIPQKEAKLIQAYLNDDFLTALEYENLKEILQKYRPALKKLEVVETLENVEDSIEYINNEKAFLDMVEHSQKVQVIPFTYTVGGKKIQMKFDLYPLNDSRIIEDVAKNLSLFKDFTDEEMITYTKIQEGKQLTREEEIIAKHLEAEVARKINENSRQTAVEYLSLQLKFHNQNSTYEDMKKVFNTMSNEYLDLLFNKVQELHNVGTLKAENVFQEFD